MTQDRPAWDGIRDGSDEITGDEEVAAGLEGPGLAPDDPALAPDDERVRRAIDALLHPTPRGAPAGDPGLTDRPRARTTGRDTASTVRPTAGDAPRLYDPSEWRWLLDSEHARAARYGTRCTIVQFEIVDIADVATHLGDDAADRLLRVLAETLLEDTRAADVYARIDGWRVAGLLPETDGASAIRPIGRIEEGFGRRLGGRLRLGLAVGRAELDPRHGPSGAVAAAERSMHLDARRLSESRPAPGASPGSAGHPGARAVVGGEASPVRDSLRDLERLRAEGLVDDDEYQATRLEILRRV